MFGYGGVNMHVYVCVYVHVYIYARASVNAYVNVYVYVHVHKDKGIFHKRATKYRALLWKMTYKDKGSYESSPPCSSSP